MKIINGNKQMKDVWKLPAIARWEKDYGKHPTQKPLSVLSRIILAGSKPGTLILDPFSGSATTGIAANLFNRNYIGIDKEQSFLDISIERKNDLDKKSKAEVISKIYGISDCSSYLLPGLAASNNSI
jgi:site-specific DNA-methyltransferase (adenine-specific)